MFNIFSWGKKRPPVRLEKNIVVMDLSKAIKGACQEKIYIVLTGGGACGRWQMGVLAYLEQIGLLRIIRGIVGTSVGALNGMACAKYVKDFDKALEMWENITENGDMFKGKIEGGIGGFMGLVTQLIGNGGKALLKPEGLYKILEVQFGGMKLCDFEMDVVTTATDLTLNEGETFTKQNDLPCDLLGKMTSAIPVAFPPVIKDGHIMVDGGWGNNNPVLTAVERGAAKVIVIGTSTKPEGIKGKVGVFEIVPAMLTYAQEKFESDMYDKIKAVEKNENLSIEMLRVYPDKSTGSVLNFGNVEQLQEGYEYAREFLTKERLEAFLLS